MTAARLTEARSLGVRLSTRLAVQNVLGLAAVALFVFLTIRAHLDGGERRTLDEMQSLVVHLIEETDVSPNSENTVHALRDQVAARADAHLELFDATGRSLLHLGPDGDDEGEWEAIWSPTEGAFRRREFTLPATRQFGEGLPLHARISLSVARDDALLVRLAYALATATVLGTLFVSAAAFWRVRRELGSVGRLVAQIDALDAERLGLQKRLVGGDQPSELLPLIGQFNELLDRLDASYRQIAAFNEDVAHELNTPLTTLIVSNEIAARGGANTAALREELIGSNLEELQRLSGIVRDMLFLSKAERGARARRGTVPSLAAELRVVIDYHEASLEEADLGVSILGDASVAVDMALVRRAVSNLLVNATRYADRGTSIKVAIESVDGTALSQGEADRPLGIPPSTRHVPNANEFVRIGVSNHGPTVAHEHLERLFDRFYQITTVGGTFDGTLPLIREVVVDSACEDDAWSRPQYGLGLAIVAAIARMHGRRPFASSSDELTTIGLTLASCTRLPPVQR